MKQYLIINRLYSVVCQLSSVFRLLSFAPLYICRESSTNHLLFMQNKPNFQKSQMNVNIYYIKEYQNFIPLAGQKNKPNSNPIKPNLVRRRRIANEYNLNYNKGLQKNRGFLSPNKQTQFLQRPKMNVYLYIIEGYENKTAFRPKKTNPKQTQFSASVVHRLRTSIFSV